LRAQPADARQQRIRRHHPVALGSNQRHPRIHKILLRGEDVEGRALADAGLLAHAVERDLGGLHLRLGRRDIGLGRIELAPGLHHGLAHGIARGIEVDALLPERFLGLADQRIFRAALVDRHAELAEHRSVVALDRVEVLRAQVVLGEIAL